MADFSIPYGAEFSPDVIKIKDLLKIVKKHNGEGKSDKLIADIAKNYFSNNQSLGNNCKNSMVAYEILERGGGVYLTSFGNELLSIKKETEIYEAMGKRILTYLNGLMFIEAISAVTDSGDSPTLVRITEMLNLMGCKTLPKTNKHVPTMKKWLEKADVLNGWMIREKQIENLVGIKEDEIAIFKGLSYAQICFVKALCNCDNGKYQNATKIRELAKNSFGVSFDEKGFAASIINPLVKNNIIKKKPSSGSHGGNASEVKIVSGVKSEVLEPILKQIETIAGKEVIRYIQKPFEELRRDIDDKNIHIKGLALEAFAIKMMQIVNLDFVGTRVKGSKTAGAEVDVLFDTTRLNYSRWQVQCKNTKTVELDQVAKEVGLSHVLKTNVIVILTTGKATKTAKEYAIHVMKELNLCIIFIEKEDVDDILETPASIIDVLNRESKRAKKIKVLDLKENDE